MRTQQSGQILVYGLAALLVVAAVLVLLYNAGQNASEKTRTVNAADAAAYSGGVWVARQLNFMAYTNRAMIANHVAVGHFVSYMSWIRYVEDSSDFIRDLTRFIPYVNVATEILATWAEYVRSGTESFGDVFVPAADTLNRALHGAQMAAKGSMLGAVDGGALTPLHEVMEHTARRYHPDLRVNHPDDLATLAGAFTGVEIVAELGQVYDFTERYDPGSDEGVMASLVLESLGGSRRWVAGDRGWTKCMFMTCSAISGNLKAGKSGSTEQEAEGDQLNWSASDELGFWQAKRKRRSASYRWRGGTVASGAATSAEFQEDYRGIPGYYRLQDQSDVRRVLNISAYTTLPIEAARMKPLLGMDAAEPRIAALARAEVYFARPDRFGEDEEFANVFNPFWRSRLVGYRSFFGF